MDWQDWINEIGAGGGDGWSGMMNIGGSDWASGLPSAMNPGQSYGGGFPDWFNSMPEWMKPVLSGLGANSTDGAISLLGKLGIGGLSYGSATNYADAMKAIADRSWNAGEPYRVVALWEAVMYYPAWSEREDFVDPLGLVAIEEIRDAPIKGLSFVSNDVRFRIHVRDWSGMEGDGYEDITLFEEDEEVFSVTCTLRNHDYFTSRSPTSINAFKVSGTWAKTLAKMFATIQREEKKTDIRLRYHNADEIKSKFQEFREPRLSAD